MVGKLYEYLVIKAPTTIHEYHQEVKDLLLLAERDFPKTPYLVDFIEWKQKWFGTSIETMKGENPYGLSDKELDEIEKGNVLGGRVIDGKFYADWNYDIELPKVKVKK